MKGRARVLSMTGFLLIAVSFASAAASTDGTAAPQELKGHVKAGVLNVRAQPGTRYEVVCQLQDGEEVRIVGERDTWYEIVAPERTIAWVAEKYVGRDGSISADRVRVHSGPGLVFTTYGYVDKTDVVSLIGEPKYGWQRIKALPSLTVWVSKEYIEVESPEITVAQAEQTDTTPAVADPPVAPDAAQAPTELAPAAEPQATAEAGTNETAAGGGVAAEPQETEANAAATPADEPPAPPAAGTTAVTDAPETAAPQAEPPAETPAAETAQQAQPEGTASDAQDAAPAEAATEDAAAPAESEQTAQSADAPGQGENDPDPAEAQESDTSVAVVADGLLMSLGDQRSRVATHVLVTRNGEAVTPVCYLRSRRIDLRDWELQEVRVHGIESEVPGWSKPVMDVSGVQLRLP